MAEAVEQPDVQPYARATRFDAELRAGADGSLGNRVSASRAQRRERYS